MATDIARIINNLCSFYDFSGQRVISAGAGGGQFVDLARRTGKIVAIDQDAEALHELKRHAFEAGLSDSFELLHSDFMLADKQGDVVLFEFCLHEMTDPFLALQHAHTLAPDIVVLDHAPGSEWTYYVVEQEKVEKSTHAMERFGNRGKSFFEAEQRFANHHELLTKVASQGPEAVARVRAFENQVDIVIPMAYAVTLL